MSQIYSIQATRKWNSTRGGYHEMLKENPNVFKNPFCKNKIKSLLDEKLTGVYLINYSISFPQETQITNMSSTEFNG